MIKEEIMNLGRDTGRVGAWGGTRIIDAMLIYEIKKEGIYKNNLKIFLPYIVMFIS